MTDPTQAAERQLRLQTMVGEAVGEARQALQTLALNAADELQWHVYSTALRRGRELLEALHFSAAVVLLDELALPATRQRGRAAAVDPDLLKLMQRALMQLPIVLDARQQGSVQGPEALLPMLNALRRKRGESALSLDALQPTAMAAGSDGPPSEHRKELIDLAESFRQQFDAWPSSPRPERQMSALAQMCDELSRATEQAQGRQLFDLAAGLLEAWAVGAFTGGPALRRVIGDLHSEILRWAALGDRCFHDLPPAAQIKTLAYFATVAPTKHPRVVALRRALGVPDPELGDLATAHARAAKVAVPSGLQSPAAEKRSSDRTIERRRSDSKSLGMLRRELNTFQLSTLNHLERFGWELRFIRHRLDKAIPVVFDSGRSRYGVLNEDGSLNDNPDFEIRA